jgi:cyclic pyranopterin phosphate synthase
MARETLSGSFDFTLRLRRSVPLRMTIFLAASVARKWSRCRCLNEQSRIEILMVKKKATQQAPRDGKPLSGKLSHYDAAGRATMVDVSGKAVSRREAEASAFIEMSAEVLKALPRNPKGNPLEVARFAGIAAAKRTSDLIPMCHPLPLSFIDVTTEVCENGVQVCSKAATTAQTGVEMEALMAATVAALTVYDMCKALDKGIAIREIVLQRKSGGKSGDYRRTLKKR